MVLKLCPNGKCLATKHHQTLFGYKTCWCWTEWLDSIKHVWSPSKWANCFTVFDQMFVDVQILWNTIKHDKKKGVQTENGYSHQRMFDHVSLSNISCLDRALLSTFPLCRIDCNLIYVLFTCFEQYTEGTTSKMLLTSIVQEQFCKHCTTAKFSTTDDDKLT